MSNSEDGKNTETKIGIVLSSTLMEWVSCRTIGSNLLKSYESYLGKDFISFDYNKHLDGKGVAELAASILRKKITHLHFLDHLPHPIALITELFKQAPIEKLPAFCFHIYGDFTFYAPEWWVLSHLLKKCKAQYLCASERQIKLVQQLIKVPSDTISLCPFPVDTSYYHFAPTYRSEGRSKFKINDDEFVVLYTGRLSMQKNVELAVQETFAFFAKKKKKIKFLLAGNFDDMGAPFFGIYPQKGHQFQKIENLRMNIPEEQGEVHWIGSLNSEDLRLAYNAADLFISLSLYHDEDFGMSPAEAISCGLPCVLSDWGGYSGFAKHSDKVHLVQAKIESKGFYFKKTDLQKALAHAFYDYSKKERESSLPHVQRGMSINAVAENAISKLWNNDFAASKGPTALLKKLAARVHDFRQHKKDYLYKGYQDPLYLDVYLPYFEKSREKHG
ncbi:MAG TPA: glycosyltransferase family 4 protein [Bdellovibrio sp.]|uniref:glycosyltransferase family 4 protein n=1 Tax=Bdellovibrio sp. TaxID=28201 RepID=UPI002F0C4D3A